MRRTAIALLTTAAVWQVSACGDNVSDISSIGSVATAAAVRCPVGYVRHGNRCDKVPTPTPTPTPTPVPTQTCWDGSIIPATSVCPVQPPPPPPPTQTCPDGTVILASAVCPPPPPPPPVQCPDGTTVPAGQTCPTPPPPPPPPAGPITSWVGAQLTVGGYACNKAQMNTPNIGPCGASIVYKLTGSGMSADAVPVPMFSAVFFQDASGNFPVNDPYYVQFSGWWAADQLVGIEPATPPVPTYGDTVEALQACVGSYIKDPIIVGTRYKVVGLTAYVPVGGNSVLGQPAGGVVLNPVVDDTVHRGDGWYALWVPFSCVAKVTPVAAASRPSFRVAFYSVDQDPPTAPPPDDSYLAVGIRYCPHVETQRGGEPYSTVEVGRRYRVTPIREGFWAHRPIPYVTTQDVDHPALGAAIVSERDCLDRIP